MRKGISVCSHDANPAVDSPVFHISRMEAAIAIDKGYAVWLTPVSIQTRPPGWTQEEEKLVSAGTVAEAWRRRWSDCYLVWQMTGTDQGAGAGVAD